SCLRGSEPVVTAGAQASQFLSCLRGSERERDDTPWAGQLSELPARQRTHSGPSNQSLPVSELPARQRTLAVADGVNITFSELPARQRTRATPLRCEATRRLAEKIRPVTQRIDRPATV